MNQQLKLLWEEAREIGVAIIQDRVSTEAQAEIFAELILRECCEVLRKEIEVALSANGVPVYPEELVQEHFLGQI